MRATAPQTPAPAPLEQATTATHVLAWPASTPGLSTVPLHASPRQVAQRQQLAAIAGSPRQVAQRQQAAASASSPPVQRERKSTAIGSELLQMDDAATPAPMAFLEPNRQPGQPDPPTYLAPVHLSKNMKPATSKGVAPSALAAITGAAAAPLSHAAFSAHNAPEAKPHLTLTNGLLAAALASSPLTAHLASKGKTTNLRAQDTAATTTSLAQNKKVAGDTVSAFAEDLGLKQFSVPDNLLFEHSPGDNTGKLTFEQVKLFHDEINKKLQTAVAQPAAGDSMPDRLPFEPGGGREGISYDDMSEQATAGAESLIAHWPAWSGVPQGRAKPISLGDFRLGEKGGDDLIKGVMGINRIHGAALGTEGNLFDEAFFREHLLKLPAQAPAGKKKEKLTDTQQHILKQLRKQQPPQEAESKREAIAAPVSSTPILAASSPSAESAAPSTTVRDTGLGLGLDPAPAVAIPTKERAAPESYTPEQDVLADERRLPNPQPTEPAAPTSKQTWGEWGWQLAQRADGSTGGYAGRLLNWMRQPPAAAPTATTQQPASATAPATKQPNKGRRKK